MDLTDVIGSTGRVQNKALIALLLRPLPGAWTTLSLLISLIEMDHWCSPTPSFRNLTSEEWKECCVPRESSGRYSRCEYYDLENGDNETKLTCSSWDYDRSSPYQSTRTDWNLVCSRGWYISVLYMAGTLGSLVAYVPSGHISDRFGRKRICIVGIVATALVCFGGAFVSSLEQMLAVRFFAGLSFATAQNSYICLYLECAGPKHRNWIIMSFSGAWGFFLMTTAAISFFITDWRILFFISSIPSHMLVLLVFWKLVPESTRWLLSVKKYKEAEKLVLKQAKENGITVENPASVMEELKKKIEMDKCSSLKQASFLDLFKDRGILKTTLILYGALFLTVFVNHGYYMSIGHLGGSLHLNLVFSAAMDMVACGFFFLLIKLLSKRKALILTFFLSGVSFLLTIPIGNDLRWLKVIFAMIGNCSSSTSYSILYVFSSEIFPTNLRVVGISGGMSAGRIGSLLASFTDDMGRVYGNGAPLALFGILSMVSSVVFLLLPELSNQHLPDSLAETKLIASGKNVNPNVELHSTSSSPTPS